MPVGDPIKCTCGTMYYFTLVNGAPVVKNAAGVQIQPDAGGNYVCTKCHAIFLTKADADRRSGY